VISRSWFSRVALRTNQPELLQAIRYLECDPEIAEDRIEELTISIEPYRSYYRIMRDGELVREQMSPQGIIESLHAELMLLSLADFPLAPIVHAASLRHKNRRLLFVGPKGAGKTLLTLRLIQEGYDFEGDENVFLTSEGLVPRPRGLRVKEAAAPLLPHLKSVLENAPHYEGPPGLKVYNLDPREAGASSWVIERGPTDAVVVLHPNHGGWSSVRPLPALELVREVMEECALPETGRAEAVGAIAKGVGSAKGFDLSLGELDSAVACIEEVCQSLS